MFKVAYLAGGRSVTSAVTAGSYRTGLLAPGRSAYLSIKVTRARSARRGSGRTFEVRSTSASQSTARDTVAAIVRR